MNPAQQRASLFATGALAALLLTGCATPRLDTARHQFFTGRFEDANQALTHPAIPDRDSVLFLMERGTVRQAMGQYDLSAADFIAASDRIKELQTYSVSKGAASWVANDNVLSYRGHPFERTLVHVFAAQSHMAQAHWEHAAVEGRRIVSSLEPDVRGDYPEDAFSRYVAGFCFEMIDDISNAALQYRKASSLLRSLQVDDRTGHILRRSYTNDASNIAAPEERPRVPGDTAELVVFVLLGRSPTGREVHLQSAKAAFPTQYAEIWLRDRCLGRSYNLTDTVDLAFTTQQIEALRTAMKTVSRVAAKESVAVVLEQNDQALLGALVRFILIGLLEQPDIRRWETLPRWLQVARVDCPPDIDEFDLVIRTIAGQEVRRLQIRQPLVRRRNILVSLFRDLPAAIPARPEKARSEKTSP